MISGSIFTISIFFQFLAYIFFKRKTFTSTLVSLLFLFQEFQEIQDKTTVGLEIKSVGEKNLSNG